MRIKSVVFAMALSLSFNAYAAGGGTGDIGNGGGSTSMDGLKFMAKRFTAAYELFDVPNGYGVKSLLVMIQEGLQTNPGALNAAAEDQFRKSLCGSGSAVDVIVKSNQKIESLGNSNIKEKAVKNSYVKNGIQNSIKPYVAFCQSKIDLKTLVKEASKFNKAETQFLFDFPMD